MSIKIISALSSNFVIGNDGKIPWFIKGELKRFKELTLNHNVVMGRKTFDSIGKLLEQRNLLIKIRKLKGRKQPKGDKVPGMLKQLPLGKQIINIRNNASISRL